MCVVYLYRLAAIRIYGYTVFVAVTKRKSNSVIFKLPANSSKVKMTIMLDSTVKKLAQLYAIEHDMTLQDVVEKALKKILL